MIQEIQTWDKLKTHQCNTMEFESSNKFQQDPTSPGSDGYDILELSLKTA
jgi:hypothetical protein